MSKFKEFKQKVKVNKGQIITGLLCIGGVAFVVRQNKQAKDIAILNKAVFDTVLPTLKNSLKRELEGEIEEITNEVLGDITDEELLKLANKLAE